MRFGGVVALGGVSFDVGYGQICGLIGPNGSGKTTLFNVITGYERIQQGEVRFSGGEITNSRPDRVFGLGVGRPFVRAAGASPIEARVYPRGGFERLGNPSADSFATVKRVLR